MATPKDESRIKTVQRNANSLWESEAKYWNAQAETITRSAAAATSEGSEKIYQEKAEYAIACVFYCRSKIG